MGDHGQPTWTKSSFSSADNCVEWALSIDRKQVLVRNSRDPEVVLTFTRADWEAFNLAARAGETELS